MRTVRRLYVYTVAFISLEVLLWGLIGLARSFFCHGNSICGQTAVLSNGLAGIIVGVPFFLVHWWLAERSARQEEEERASAVRAVFLYGSLLATLIPIVQNLLSLLDRAMLTVVGLSSRQALFGPNQSWSDNIIAMVMNAVFAAYFINILRRDCSNLAARETSADVRRLYRHLWMAYTLTIVVGAVEQLLRFLLQTTPGGLDRLFRASGAHGVVLAVVGTPLWYFAWRSIQVSLREKGERESNLRLAMLYLFSLAGVFTVLTSAGVVLDSGLKVLFGQAASFSSFLNEISIPVSIGVPLGGMWAYFGRWLERAISGSADDSEQAGKRRLYLYILSAAGMGAAFTGLTLLLAFVVDAAIGHIVWAQVLRPRLAAALATLLVGLPLWLLTWRPVQAQALSSGDPGDHARRSIIRRVYLYLALFSGVVGGMIVAVSLVNLLLRSLFGSPEGALLQNSLKEVELLFLFVGLGLYHGLTLRSDGRTAAQALAEKHAAFPVWVFDDGGGTFGPALVATFSKQMPRLPVTLQSAGTVTREGIVPAAAVLPAGLAVEPPPALKAWLGTFSGHKLVVPTSLDQKDAGWSFSGEVRSLAEAAEQAARTIRQMAEGQKIRQEPRSAGWMAVVYVAAGLFAVEVLIGLVSLGMSLLGR